MEKIKRLLVLCPLYRGLRAFFLVLIFFSSPFVFSQQSVTPTPSKTFIWKVSKDGKNLYLAGSVHLLRPKDMPLPSRFKEVFDKSEECYFEMDTREAQSPQAMLLIQQKGMYQGDDDLRKHISKETASKLDEYLRSQGYPENTFDMMRPWFLSMNLIMMESMKMGAAPDLGLDQQISQWAIDAGKPLKGFETMEDQIGLLSGFPDKVQDEFLLSSIQDISKLEKFYDDTILAWKTGNAAKLNELMNESVEKSPELYDLILVKRNKNWLPKIESALDSGKTAFVIVGAAHITGKDGLLELLKAKGYLIEQM